MSLVCEAAYALADFANDPMELLAACKRLVERRPGCGPLVWVCARILSGSDPVTEAYDCVAALQRDRTALELADRIPSEASVLAVGSSELTCEASLRRPDIDLTISEEALGVHGQACVRPDHGLDLLILEADVVSGDGALFQAGVNALAATAKQTGVPVWLVVGLGRVLLDQMWIGATDSALRGQRVRLSSHDFEVTSLDCVDTVIGPSGLHPVSELQFRRECPIVPELFA